MNIDHALRQSKQANISTCSVSFIPFLCANMFGTLEIDVRGNQQLIKHQIKTKIFTLSSGAMFLPAAFQNNYAMEKTEPHSLRGYTSYILNKVIKTTNSFLLFHVNELII